MTDLLTARIRTGRHNPQALYAQLGDQPADTDPSVGWARTPEIARQAVEAVNNGRRIRRPWWQSLGCLVYDKQFNGMAQLLVSDWIIALSSEDLAARIADAANGQVSDG